MTIERKKPGRKPMDPDNHIPSSGTMVDRVEITKVPVNVSTSGGTNGNRSCSPSVSITTRDFPSSSTASDVAGGLNLSVRPTSAATITPGAGGIPSDYYASQALSGVFLAEQIRQQQLAAALESRLSESSAAGGKSAASATSELMQAALLMNRLKEQQQSSSSTVLGASETSKLLAIAAAAAAASSGSSVATPEQWAKQTKSSSRKVPPKKNTVASLLEQAKSGRGQFGKLTPEELELAERATGNPELTIEPLFKGLKPDR